MRRSGLHSYSYSYSYHAPTDADPPTFFGHRDPGAYRQPFTDRHSFQHPGAQESGSRVRRGP